MIRRIRKIKPVTIGSHPNFYNKMEEIRKEFKRKNINLSQVQITHMISKNIRMPNINNIMGVKNVKRKKG